MIRRADDSDCITAPYQRGQSTLSYVIFFAIIVSAVITVQVYVKRGFMGRYHEFFQPWGDAYIPGRTDASVVGDHLIETGTSTDTVDIKRDETRPGSGERITTVTYTVDSTVQESGGDSVTIESAAGLF